MTLLEKHCLFGAYCLMVAGIHGRTLRSLYDYSRQDMSASHLVLIPFVSLAIAYQFRRTIFASVCHSARLGGGTGLVGAILGLAAMLLPGGDVLRLSLAVTSLIVMWIGGFLFLYGAPAARAALFPLAFLAFTIPIPPVLLDGVVGILKSGSAEVVDGLFTLTRTPHLREGFVFELPSVIIEIADECSGIRSTIALLLTTLLVGYLYLDRSWSRTLLVLMVIPVTILKNGIRIVALSLLSIHVDPGFLTGQLHHEGGIVFFLMALMMLVPVLVVLRRAENKSGLDTAGLGLQSLKSGRTTL
jgi:exosortase